jgi:hypothetical protein
MNVNSFVLACIMNVDSFVLLEACVMNVDSHVPVAGAMNVDSFLLVACVTYECGQLCTGSWCHECGPLYRVDCVMYVDIFVPVACVMNVDSFFTGSLCHKCRLLPGRLHHECGQFCIDSLCYECG